jgi:hypothetical protein
MVKADEKVVARLLELKPDQKKAWGGNREAPEIKEFDRLLSEELERGVLATELAFLLEYKTSQAITNRYKRYRGSYSIGFTQDGEVKHRKKFSVSIPKPKGVKPVGRPRAEIYEGDLQILSELEVMSEEISNLQNKLTTLTYSAVDKKIPQKNIANALGISISDVKYLVAKRAKPEWFVRNRKFKGGDVK